MHARTRAEEVTSMNNKGVLTDIQALRSAPAIT
jgi:hypothetical protein